MRLSFISCVLAVSLSPGAVAGQYSNWRHSGYLYILTTPEGANLPPTAVEKGFPLLVRFDEQSFNFSKARPGGEDIRFSGSDGRPLAYQIDTWDRAKERAAIWVRIPTIKGNSRQAINVHWGKADAVDASSGRAVFDASNGFLSVWHMGETVQDELGTVFSKDSGTTEASGRIGGARHFAGGKGVFCGDKISSYPSGDNPSTTEAWFRTDKPNTTILGWGKEGGQGGKVRMMFRSPPHIKIDSDFADVRGVSTLRFSEWHHVVHTYEKGDSRVYLNGRLDGATKPIRNILSPARMWIGGWYENYDYVGQIDEVRISSVARSADWIRLEHENQKPLQTLAGALVEPGDAFSTSPTRLELAEGESATVVAEAGGAEKTYWILRENDQERVVAVDRRTFTLDPGRVLGNKVATLQFKAIYAAEVKTIDIDVRIREHIPEPVFTLKAPRSWNGRDRIEIVPQVANLDELRARGVGDIEFTWGLSGIAVIKKITPGKLTLLRSQGRGALTVTLAARNGGAERTQTSMIEVEEPAQDSWLARVPGRDEKPEDHQFYARNDNNLGVLHYNGTLKETAGSVADSVYLKVYAADDLFHHEEQALPKDGSYAFSAKLEAGLVKYRVEFGSRTGDRATVLDTVTNIVCGDAYIIQGQSNAEATDGGRAVNPFSSEWIRSFGSMRTDRVGARLKRWGNARSHHRDYRELEIGYWGVELARMLVEEFRIPICIVNGAQGGTRIDQHLRSGTDPTDVRTIYGRLLWRVQQARLTHGIRGVLWHQGENDQGAAGPSGGWGWETYRQNFIDLSAAWKEDYPNIQNYYVFQIWPKACSMGRDGSDNRLREVQRTLPSRFSNLRIMSTLGIRPGGGCHYPAEGYARMAHSIYPLVARDNYGKVYTRSITPPDLKRAYYTSPERDEIALEFDQGMAWEGALAEEFYLDGLSEKVASGSASGDVLRLRLTGPSQAKRITYVDGGRWNERKAVLRGVNGIAALTFNDVPISGHDRRGAR